MFLGVIIFVSLILSYNLFLMLIYWVTKLIILMHGGGYQDLLAVNILWVFIYFVLAFRLAIFRYVYKINKAIEIIYISFLSITIFITGERNAVLSTMLFLFILIIINKNLRHTTILSILIIFMTCFFILKNSEILKHRYSFGSLPTMSEINMNENEIDIKK